MLVRAINTQAKAWVLILVLIKTLFQGSYLLICEDIFSMTKLEKRIRLSSSDSLFFELLIRQFFGDRANQSAGAITNLISLKRWLRKVAKQIQKRINELEVVDMRLKEVLIDRVVSLDKRLREANDISDLWAIIFNTMFIISYLLGYDWVDGKIYRTPQYYQTLPQAFMNRVNHKRKRVIDVVDEKKNAISVRRKLALELKTAGYDNFTIALILNTSEYEIMRLLKTESNST